VPSTTSQPDLFWMALDWIVKAAGSLLLVVLTLGWKEWRRKISKIDEIHALCQDMKEAMGDIAQAEKDIVELRTEIRNLKEVRRA